MEFLKGLQEAQAMGLTMEEFIDIWKIESKMAEQANEVAASSASVLTARPQVESTDAKAALTDHNDHTSSTDRQRLEENSHHFLSNFQHTCNQLMDKQEQQWKQFQFKNDQMMEELRCRFALLSDHTTDVADCNTNSIKVYIMQELGLLQQQLQQKMEEQSANHGCGSDREKISGEIQELASVEVSGYKTSETLSGYKTSETLSGYKTSETLSKKNELDKIDRVEPSTPGEQLETSQRQTYMAELDVNQQNKTQLDIPIYVNGLKEAADNIKPHMDVLNTNGKRDSNAIASTGDGVPRNQYNPRLAMSGFITEEVQCINVGSVGAKMSFAQAAIESQKNQVLPSHISSASSQALSGSCSSLNSTKYSSDAPTHSVAELPIGTQVFTVTLSEQSGVFLSPVMYSRHVRCRARFRGNFDAAGTLHVSLHVKSSVHDDDHTWPLVLTGTGNVFHRGSNEYTPAWRLPPTTCGKPLSAEGAYVFSCVVESIDAKAALTDQNDHTSSTDWQRLEENSHHFLSNFQHTCNQLMDKQEQQWKQLQFKNDQMMEELRCRFALLSDHTTNVVDCNTNSIKVYIMQELGLLQQQLQQKMEEQSANHGCGSDREKISGEFQELASVEVSGYKTSETLSGYKTSETLSGYKTSETLSGYKTSETLSKKNELDKMDRVEPSTPQEQLETSQRQTYMAELDVNQQNKTHLDIPVYVNGPEEAAENRKPHMDVINTNGKTDSNAIASIDEGVPRNRYISRLAMSGFITEEVQCINVGSVGAKMSFAQAAIESQKNQVLPSHISSASSQALSGSCSSLNSTKYSSDAPTHSVAELPIGTQVFTVNVVNGVFLSPVMYSSGVPCRARFRGNFDAAGTLKVSLHVKSCVYDDDHKWPLVLSGTGNVFHRGSNEYTQVWRLPPTTCGKPLFTDGACVFSCVVCLRTSRHEYPNVTYKQLVSSKYIENNSLTMKCTFSATIKP